MTVDEWLTTYQVETNLLSSMKTQFTCHHLSRLDDMVLVPREQRGQGLARLIEELKAGRPS